MTLRIATWNINSIRPRLASLRRLVAEAEPDVVCLQETKVQDGDFPRAPLAALGYRHDLVHGMKNYNGVAILSRVPFAEAGTRNWCGRQDCRHAFARLQGGIELHNVYVPAGGDVPDPARNEKFAHKLAFLQDMADWFAARRRPGNRFVLAGDLNVAPLETDVWSHKRLLKVVSHTPVEVALLGRLRASHDWTDAVRHFIPPELRLYSWWSYRARDWAASDRGRRLDHIWLTPALTKCLKGAEVLRRARGWEGASDHVPVLVTLEGRV